MRYAYFLVAENKTDKEKAELDELLDRPISRRSIRPAAVPRLGGEIRTGGKR